MSSALEVTAEPAAPTVVKEPFPAVTPEVSSAYRGKGKLSNVPSTVARAGSGDEAVKAAFEESCTLTTKCFKTVKPRRIARDLMMSDIRPLSGLLMKEILFVIALFD
ncbi:hypothetical protein F0562_019659 [Nyssa sinensis]|uniref:Uncharacterized protein n=1 Tax=Nyssa sinensis TaxID=561372 RepID=A0A5J5BQP6_9ASTE|nr:hypothetical protein F0562_019659 [Nyssa sinensis]